MEQDEKEDGEVALGINKTCPYRVGRQLSETEAPACDVIELVGSG